ncbi:MAG: homoserine O-acetyltransferase [Lysobacteraceae bacterium]|nr:MAG: homoserine O-acetyltransferase [Xanthomonadaceae bacterium]
MQTLSTSPADYAACGDGDLTLSRFQLTHGDRLARLQIKYRIEGPSVGPIIAVFGGISADRHVCDQPAQNIYGWWRDLAGPGKAIDTNRVRVLSFDFIGGFGDSTGPDHNEWKDSDFPAIDTRDQARALALLLDYLGVDQLAAVVGSSYGGMIALSFGRLYGHRTQRVLAISAADRALPSATAFRSIQRDLLRLGLEQGCETEALTLARALAMVTYRCNDELDQRFDARPGQAPGGFSFPVHAYLRSRGWAFARRATSRAYLTLSQSTDLHRLEGVDIECPVTLVASSSDRLIPPQQSRDFAERIAGPSRFHKIQSGYGHDAFLKEPDAIAAILRDELSTTEEVAA